MFNNKTLVNLLCNIVNKVYALTVFIFFAALEPHHTFLNVVCHFQWQKHFQWMYIDGVQLSQIMT